LNKKPSGCRLSQAQIAQLFHTSADNISLHLKNIFAEKAGADWWTKPLSCWE